MPVEALGVKDELTVVRGAGGGWEHDPERRLARLEQLLGDPGALEIAKHNVLHGLWGEEPGLARRLKVRLERLTGLMVDKGFVTEEEAASLEGEDSAG